jgi:putative peptidoglycan lipid II flippase
LLWRGLRRDGVYRPTAGWGRLVLRVLLANAAMVVALLIASPSLEVWLGFAPLERALRLALCIVTGAVAYVGALALFGMRPAHLRTQAQDRIASRDSFGAP